MKDARVYSGTVEFALWESLLEELDRPGLIRLA